MNVKKTTIFFLFMVFAFFSNNTFAETIRLADSPSQEIKAQQQVQPLSSLKRKDTATYDDTYRLAYLKDKNPSEKIMGITRLQWETELSKFKDFELDKDFVDIVKKTEKAIDSRWGTEYFQRINGEKTVKEYQRNNPLLAYKKRRNISKFFANIDLSQQEFNYMLNFIPTLKGVYSDEEIAILVPYIAFAETHDISRGRIRVLVKRALDKGTPVDVITDRLFRTVLEEFQYKD